MVWKFVEWKRNFEKELFDLRKECSTYQPTRSGLWNGWMSTRTFAFHPLRSRKWNDSFRKRHDDGIGAKSDTRWSQLHLYCCECRRFLYQKAIKTVIKSLWGNCDRKEEIVLPTQSVKVEHTGLVLNSFTSFYQFRNLSYKIGFSEIPIKLTNWYDNRKACLCRL